MPTLTLIVCTRNRAGYLPATLAAFASLDTTDGVDIIIVDNGSTDDTPRLLDAFARQCPDRVRVVREERRGLANAQNAGLRVAQGDILAFTDDDCYPCPDYLQRIRECFLESPIDFLGGRVLLHDPEDAPITIQTSETRVELPPHSYIPAGLIHGAAFAFTREAMQKLQGFDPDTGSGSTLDSGNDINTLIRCSALGLRGAYDPRPVVYHHHRRKPGADVEVLMRRYDVSRGAAFFLGLSHPATRAAYTWPLLRRVAGNVLKGRWGTLAREVSGGYRYARIRAKRAGPERQPS
jgi:glycosyltransferase involved in cell wall biosynthesis